MDVKSILKKIRQKDEEKKERLLAIQLEGKLVKSALWIAEEGIVKVLAIGESQFWVKEEDFLPAVDASLPAGGETEPNKVIFGVSPEWVLEGKIIPDQLQILKKIAKELELIPLGFVVTPEAIVYHLKVTEGIPLTAILVGLEKDKLVTTLVKLGKIVGTQLAVRSGDLGADLAEALSRFAPQETFPPRILLYNQGENLEGEKQQLMSYSWSETEVSFLHLPKVEVLPPDFDIQSVALAGGREIAEVEGIRVEPREAELAPKLEEEKTEIRETEVMGFIKGKDISQEKPPAPKEIFPKVEEKKLVMPKLDVAKIINFLSVVKSKIKIKSPLPGGVFSDKTRWVSLSAIVFLVITGGILFSLWWYFPKAEVILRVKPQVLEKDFLIKLDPNLKIADKEKLALPAYQLAVVSESKKTAPTTGTKLIGEPAKGEVTIYNGTGGEKKFASGTTINSPSGIKFTLDDEVIIASRSSAADPSPSKKVKITAVEIGSEGNLAAGAEFAVANFSKSDFVAKNESAFVGGTSREVQVISKKDQEDLAEKLTTELKGKAVEELKTKTSANRKLIEESISSKIVERNFNKKIDEEADEVSLDLKVEFSALSYSEEEFRSLVEEEIKKAVPEGFEYKPEESEVDFTLKELNKSGLAIFSAHFKANLFPVLDIEGIKRNLTGKQPEIGKAYLGALPAVDSFEAEITPRLPAKLMTFPRITKNIKIEIRKK